MEVQEEVSRLIRKVTSPEDILSDFIYHTKRDSRLLKDEMRMFKDEMSELKEEMHKDRQEQNKKWGKLNNRLGTFAEEVAAPNMLRVSLEQFGSSYIIDYGVVRRRVNPNDSVQYFEFDAITLTYKYIFLLESKFTPRDEYIKISENHVHVRVLTQLGVYVMAMGESTMELLDFETLQNVKK
ncbi:MAG: hypothetical protein R2822_15855 [Spirosomataceae bacterium]